MSDKFRIEHEGPLPAVPEQVWLAVTRDSEAWLMPSEPMKDTAIVWDPPYRCVAREQSGDWFHQIEFQIEARDGGSYIRYVHSGVFEDDWDTQYDGARKHTGFYMHTLAEYLKHFQGRPYRHVEVHAPPTSATAAGLQPVRTALGIHDTTEPGGTLVAALPTIGEVEAVLDFHNEYFIGLRTSDALYRFFGRNFFGAPVVLGAYQYGAQDVALETVADEWTGWLADVFGGAA
nr:SRPBCC domain-containing protein [Actinomadura rugatobispora]